MHTHAKAEGECDPCLPPGVLTHTIPDCGSLMIAAGTHTQGKMEWFCFHQLILGCQD